MKPAIKFLIFLLLFSASNVMVAQHVSIEAAIIIAENHFASVNKSGLASAQDDGWKVINPRPHHIVNKKVHFVDDKTGFILNQEQLLKTTDAGETWEEVMRLKNGYNIAFKDSVGYITGVYNTFYKSTDSGNSWQKINLPFEDEMNHISIITKDILRITNPYKMFASDDGGITWRIHSIDDVIVNESFFTSADVGHVVTHQGILKTTNGGKSWYKTYDRHNVSEFLTVFFTDETTGYASCKENIIYKTDDGGETWKIITSLGYYFFDMQFINKDTGYICGRYGAVYKTTDGGVNWKNITPGGGYIPASDLFSLYFTSERDGFVTGNRGRILKTTDGGNTWKGYAATYEDIYQVALMSDSVAYIRAEARLFKTTDGGKTICEMEGPLHEPVTGRIYFIDEITGYALLGGAVYKTSDGALTWVKTHDVPYLMEHMGWLQFLDEQNGFVSGISDKFMLKKTTDGGKTWQSISTPEPLTQIQFLDSLTGYATNTDISSVCIYKTMDGGENWEIILKDNAIIRFDFINERDGFAIGNRGYMYKTSDGGKNWEKLFVPIEYPGSLKFISKNTGLIIDGYGRLKVTMNGGNTWEQWTEVYGINSLAVFSEKIWTSGISGIILENSIQVDSLVIHVNPAGSVTNNSTVISGHVASNGETVDSVFIEYYRKDSDITRINLGITIENDSSAPVLIKLENLKGNTGYHYRLCVVQGDRKYYSSTESFFTLRDYDIFIQSAKPLSSDEARFSGTIYTMDAEITNIGFIYGTGDSTEYFIPAQPVSVPPGQSSAVTALATSLSPNTNYFARLKANYKGQDIYSTAEIRFTTFPEYVLSYNAPVINENNIVVEGTLKTNKDTITELLFRYGKTRDYKEEIIVPVTIVKGEQESFRFQMNDLDSGTIYFYRLVFVMGGDTIYGEEKVVSSDKQLVMVVMEASRIAENAVLARAVVNTYGKTITNIRFHYGVNGVYQDSIRPHPYIVAGHNPVTVQAEIHGLVPGSHYVLKLSAVDYKTKVYSEPFSFFTEGTTSTGDYPAGSHVKIYPNPVADFLRIETVDSFVKVELYDQFGKMLIQTVKNEIDMTGLVPGLFFVKVYFKDKATVVKIVKK